MKKNTILKVLSFVLLLTFVFSAVLLTGCGKQEDAAKQADLEATNADLKSAQDEITKLQTAIGKLQEASATSEELSRKVAALETAVEAVSGDPEAIRQLVAEIEAASEALDAAKEELGAAVQEAADALGALDDIYATDEELAAAVAELKAEIAALDEIYATKAELADAIANLQAQINDRLVKSDWIAATNVLFKGTEERRSIASFEAGIVRVYLLDANGKPTEERDSRAIPYEDEDIVEYEAKADLLAKKLLRAISVEDIDSTFDLRDAEFAKLVKILDKFDAELTSLEPDKDENGEVIPGTGKLYFPKAYQDNFYGNNPEKVDQLARLDYLKDLIDERELFPTETEEEIAYKEAQEARYDAIHEAQDRLAAAEEDDEDIYEHQEELGLGRGDTVYLKDETKENLDIIKGEYDEQVAPQFDEELVDTTYYAVDMEDLPGYVNYLNKLARYNALLDAKAEFSRKYPELTHFQDYNITDPMLEAYNGIETIDGAWLDDWKERWALEDIRTIVVENDQGEVEIEKDFELENCFIIVDSVDQAQSEGQQVTRLGGYARVLAIRYFVQTLKSLETTYVLPLVAKDEHEDITTKNLIGQIQTEVKLGANKVLWAHVPTLDDIFAKQDAIYEAIDNLKFELNVDFTAPISYDYNPKANCKKNLLGLDKLTNGEAILAAIRERVETLKDTMQDLIDLGEALFETYYVEGEWVVSLRDGNYIKIELPATVKGYFTERNIYVDDEDTATNEENYNVMTEFFRFNIQPYLNAAYDNITEILKTIWKDVKDVVERENIYLPDLNKLITAQAEVFKVMRDATVNEVNFVLDDTTGYKFSEFFYRLFTKVVTVVELAQNAEKDAIEINEAIENLGTQFNLNKTAAVDRISEAVVDWSVAYLGVEFPELDDEDHFAEAVMAYFADIAVYFVDTKVEEKTLTYPVYIVALDEKGEISIIADYEHPYTRTIKTVANDGILNVHEYNNETISSTEVYDFITGENFTALKAIQATRVARYKAAAKAWAEVDMTPIANRADIDASFEAFTAYVQEYYTSIRTFEDECDAIKAYYGLVGEEQCHYDNSQNKIVDKTAEQDLAEKIAAKMVEEATGSQGIKMKADRYASYIIDAQFGENLAYGWSGEEVDPTLSDEEAYGKYYAHGSLCSRSYQYDQIMDLTARLDDQTVPAEYVDVFEADVRTLKNKIDNFCEEFDYYTYEYVTEFVYVEGVQQFDEETGEPLTEEVAYITGILPIYNDAITAANGERLDAELVAYVGAAKVYIINAFAKNQAGSYLYVKDVVEAGGTFYELSRNEETVLTSYCVEALQKICVTVDQVDTLIDTIRQLALDPEREEYPEFDFDSEIHFQVVIEQP